MSCRRCEVEEGLEVCLYCGHAFCRSHRGERDGLAACVACLEAEVERERVRAAADAAPRPSRGAPPAAAPLAGLDAAVRSPAPSRPPPLAEPPGWGPALWGLLGAAPAGAYLYWLLGWLSARHELPGWLPPAGAAAGAALAFAGVWAIAKTRAASRPSRG